MPVNSQKPEGDDTRAVQATDTEVEDKRAAARRRFLKMGAGGSTAMVATIMHKRAFAGTVNKSALLSQCVSLQGVLDMKGMTQKNALQVSAMGTPKGAQCVAKPPTNQCVSNKVSKYYNSQGKQVVVVDGAKLTPGCGNFDDTMLFQRDHRLYQLGYCPVKAMPDGTLTYDSGAVYFDQDSCTVGQIHPTKGRCVGIGKDKSGKSITYWQRSCE